MTVGPLLLWAYLVYTIIDVVLFAVWLLPAELAGKSAFEDAPARFPRLRIAWLLSMVWPLCIGWWMGVTLVGLCQTLRWAHETQPPREPRVKDRFPTARAIKRKDDK